MKTISTQAVIDHFYRISQCPRPSGREDKVRVYLQKWADDRGYNHRTDTKGNLAIIVPATDDCRHCDQIALQAHMDMVCVAESSHDFDPLNDPIEVYEEDGYLKAHKTSLGSDNGIGLAQALVCAELERHPAFELIFTVEEEIGLVGALQIDPNLITSTYLLNLDHEANDELCIGMASQVEMEVSLPVKRGSESSSDQYIFRIDGLKGGHSGVDIHEPRGNAIILLLDVLRSYTGTKLIYDLHGGVADNAIPSFAHARISLGDKQQFLLHCDDKLSLLNEQLDTKDLHFSLEEVSGEEIQPILNFGEIADQILQYGTGILELEEKLDSPASVSRNLGVCRASDASVDLIYLARAYSMERSEKFAEDTRVHFGDGNVTGGVRCGSWREPEDSPFVQKILASMRSIDPEAYLGVIHAALEAGVFPLQKPGLQVGAIGPYISSPHSPHEKVLVSDIEKANKYLDKIIKDWCEL